MCSPCQSPGDEGNILTQTSNLGCTSCVYTSHVKSPGDQGSNLTKTSDMGRTHVFCARTLTSNPGDQENNLKQTSGVSVTYCVPWNGMKENKHLLPFPCFLSCPLSHTHLEMDDIRLAVERTPAELSASRHLFHNDPLTMLLQCSLQDLLVHLASTRWFGSTVHILGNPVGLVLLPQSLKLRLGQVLNLCFCHGRLSLVKKY